MAGDDGQIPQNVAAAIVDVSERVAVLVREEIELAKTEVSEKISKLIKGAVVGIAAGIFAVTGLLFLLHGAAWGLSDWVFGDHAAIGFFVTAGVLFLLGALAGFLAARAFKAGAPPVPEMAIDEARKIRAAVGAGAPDAAVDASAAAQWEPKS